HDALPISKPTMKDFYGFKYKPFRSDENNYLVISEGIFDILCAFKNKNLEKIKNKSNIWACCLSNYYDNSIDSILDFYKLPSIHVIILSDNDKPIKHYKSLKYKPEILSLQILYNKKYHDFGCKDIEPIKMD